LCFGLFARASGATLEARFVLQCRLLPSRSIAKLLEVNKVSGAGDENRTLVRSFGRRVTGNYEIPRIINGRPFWSRFWSVGSNLSRRSTPFLDRTKYIGMDVHKE
jgi:hypothetical protein